VSAPTQERLAIHPNKPTDTNRRKVWSMRQLIRCGTSDAQVPGHVLHGQHRREIRLADDHGITSSSCVRFSHTTIVKNFLDIFFKGLGDSQRNCKRRLVISILDICEVSPAYTDHVCELMLFKTSLFSGFYKGISSRH